MISQYKHVRIYTTTMTKRIIIEGIIGAGKSTCLEALQSYQPLKCTYSMFPELVEEWEELPLFYQDPKKWCLSFSLRVLLTQFKQHNEALRREDDTAQVFERSPLASRYVFTQIQFNDGIMTQKEWETYKSYYEVMKWEPSAQDMIIYIDTPVEVCHQRIEKRGRNCESGVTLEYLHKLDFQYRNMLKYVECPVHYIDGSQSQKDVALAVRNLIADFIIE